MALYYELLPSPQTICAIYLGATSTKKSEYRIDSLAHWTFANPLGGCVTKKCTNLDKKIKITYGLEHQ